jgi:hypothetical protein
LAQKLPIVRRSQCMCTQVRWTVCLLREPRRTASGTLNGGGRGLKEAEPMRQLSLLVAGCSGSVGSAATAQGRARRAKAPPPGARVVGAPRPGDRLTWPADLSEEIHPRQKEREPDHGQ